MTTLDSLRWDIRQRLMYLEARVIWTGHVAPADLRETFGVSVAQADKDFALYQEQSPDNLLPDDKGGAYVASDRFEPRLLRGSAQEFLLVLRNHGLKAGAPDSPLAALLGGIAPAEVIERPEREFDVRILQRVTAAIREKRWLVVEYQSMTHPEPRPLLLAPHALASAGRWHLRAWSQTHNGYRDFLLARISGIPELKGACEKNAQDDWDWRNFVNVKVGAHPGLTPPQKRVIEADYGMHSGVLERAVRVALVPYYLQMLGLNRESSSLSPAEQPLTLLNRSELEVYNRFS
ncbi:MAG: WYL domain-containing protein [Pseudomonadota bacterium]